MEHVFRSFFSRTSAVNFYHDDDDDDDDDDYVFVFVRLIQRPKIFRLLADFFMENNSFFVLLEKGKICRKCVFFLLLLHLFFSYFFLLLTCPYEACIQLCPLCLISLFHGKSFTRFRWRNKYLQHWIVSRYIQTHPSETSPLKTGNGYSRDQCENPHLRIFPRLIFRSNLEGDPFSQCAQRPDTRNPCWHCWRSDIRAAG